MQEKRENELEHCVTKFVPKKKNKKTLGRMGYVDENGGCHIRACVEIEKQKMTTKCRPYKYGRIQITGISPDLIEKTAWVQIYIPNNPIGGIEFPNILQDFLEQPGNTWPKLLESKEDKNSGIKKEIATKVRSANQ